MEDRVRCEGELRKRHDIAGSQRKRLGILDVENLQDEHLAIFGAVNERLKTLHKQGQIRIAPIGAMAERFLRVNYEKSRLNSGHRSHPSVVQLPMLRSCLSRLKDMIRTKIGQKKTSPPFYWPPAATRIVF